MDAPATLQDLTAFSARKSIVYLLIKHAMIAMTPVSTHLPQSYLTLSPTDQPSRSRISSRWTSTPGSSPWPTTLPKPADSPPKASDVGNVPINFRAIAHIAMTYVMLDPVFLARFRGYGWSGVTEQHISARLDVVEDKIRALFGGCRFFRE